jgi:hypothetical protein
MPMTCYGYPADLPPGAAKDAGAQAALSDVRNGNLGPAQPALPGLRQMPFGSCIRY